MIDRISARTEISKLTTATNPVNRFIYLGRSPLPFEPAVLAALRAKVAADCAAERNRNSNPSDFIGTPDSDASRRSRRSTQGSKSSTQGSKSSPPSLSHPTADPTTAPHVFDEAEARRRLQRTRAFRYRHEGRSLIRDLHNTVALCGLGVIDNPDGSPGTSRFSCDHGSGAVRQQGVMTCHSPLACPVCAPRVAARRARALTPQVEAHVAEGGTVSLVTLTLRHDRTASLRQMRRALAAAWARVTSGKWICKLRKIGKIEFVRGFDITWSEKHGWHPHLHVTLFLGGEHDNADVCEALVTRWRRALFNEGWTTTREAQHYHRADDPAAAARYAVSPAAVYEALAMSMKRARGKGAGLTPFEILERALDDKRENVEGSAWIARWREYVGETMGCRQAVTSQGLTLELEVKEEDADTVEDTVLEVGSEALREMDASNLVPAVLDAIDDHIGDPEGMRVALAVLMKPVRAWWSIPGWAGNPRTFRTEKDDLDRRAEAVKNSPDEKAEQAVRDRAKARMPESKDAGNHDPAEILLSAQERFRLHLTP